MQQIVINTQHGGFGVSEMGCARYREICGKELDEYTVKRNDLDLVLTILTLGSEQSSGRYAKLKIVEVPDDVEWAIHEYDGREWVAEAHRTWS
jgi:hypothetical protein